MIIRSQQSLGLKSAVFWVLHNCSLTNQNLVVRSTQKLTVHDIKINQGVGWSFDGLGGEFRSREVLAPSKVKVKFQVAKRSAPARHWCDISLYPKGSSSGPERGSGCHPSSGIGLIEIGSRFGASQLQPNEPKSGYPLQDKCTVLDMKIKQGGGWAFEGLGKEFRSHEVLPPSNVKVKFRSQSEIHLPDIGAASLYTHKKQIPLVFGRAVQLVYEGSDVAQMDSSQPFANFNIAKTTF